MLSTTQIINEKLNAAEHASVGLGITGVIMLLVGLLTTGIGAAIGAASNSKEKQEHGLKISNNGVISAVLGLFLMVSAMQMHESTRTLIKKSKQQLTCSDILSISGSLLTGPSGVVFSILLFVSINSNFKSLPAMLTPLVTCALGFILTTIGHCTQPVNDDESINSLLPRP